MCVYIYIYIKILPYPTTYLCESWDQLLCLFFPNAIVVSHQCSDQDEVLSSGTFPGGGVFSFIIFSALLPYGLVFSWLQISLCIVLIAQCFPDLI